VIGWTGSHTSEQYLEVVRPALERVRRRHDFLLVVVGGGAFSSPGLDIVHRPWRSSTEVADLSDFDIGIMPLPDSEWERGKCGLKALQYMALGVPTVVSPVGVNKEIVEHGRNGLLAASDDEWEKAIELLLTDVDSRRRLGAEGRATVESTYSAAVHAPHVADIFREAVA
jgi:glycosyltransferase involved in cell wall biosynthesis